MSFIPWLSQPNGFRENNGYEKKQLKKISVFHWTTSFIDGLKPALGRSKSSLEFVIGVR